MAFYIGASDGPSVSNQASSINLSKGLVGWWKLNGNTNDSTPYGNNGVNYGATPTTDRNGVANGAYSFNGSSNYIGLPDTALPATPTKFTLSAWFKTSAGAGGIINRYAVTGGGGYRLTVWNSELLFTVDNGSYYNLYSTSTVNDNKWHNGVATWDGTTMKIYVDGVLEASMAGANPTSGGNGISNIGYNIQAGSYFNGSISSVRVYSRALSQAEVTALYKQYGASTKTGSEANGLVGWWKMHGNANDSTPYGNNGTVNSATLTADREGSANSAYSFNGTSSVITTPSKGFPTGSATRSVFAWVYATSYPSTWAGIDSYGTNASDESSVLSINATGNVSFNGWGDDYVSSLVLPLNSWHLVGYTYTQGSTSVTLWLDGQSQTGVINSVLSTPNTGTTNYIGSMFATYYWLGDISGLRVYTRALTSSDVSALYNSYNSQVCLGGCGQSINLQKGLVGYWPFAGNANDATPYGDNGTINGATLTTDREGRANSAYSFNGTSDSISVPASNSLNTKSAITILAWIKPEGSSQQPIVEYNNGSTIGVQLWQYSDFSTLFTNLVDTSGVSHYLYSPSGEFVAGTWYQVAVTYNGSTVTLYVDGSSVATSNLGAFTLQTSYPVWVGTRPSGSSYFNGSISGVRIYNRALSPAEIQALYNEYQ